MGKRPVGALTATLHGARGARVALWVEFVCLFVGAPLAIALFLNPRWMFAALFGFTLVGLGLIWHTGDFQWRELVRGWGRVRWGRTLAFGVVVAAIGWLVMAVTYPGFTPNLSGPRLRILLAICLLYPLLSALPQELIFRALFFHRYRALLGGEHRARLVNAAVFSLAHLMYWSPVVSILTFAGGWLFADVYLKRGFPAVWALHGIAGIALFVVGMGAFFWSGNVVRPF